MELLRLSTRVYSKNISLTLAKEIHTTLYVQTPFFASESGLAHFWFGDVCCAENFFTEFLHFD